MVNHVVLLLQVEKELAFCSAAIGFLAALLGFRKGATNNQDRIAIVLHGFEGLEHDSVVDFPGRVLWQDGVSDRVACIVAHRSEWRVHHQCI